jgi:hypothetical protein
VIRFKSKKKASGIFRECENLWKAVVNKRAGGKSELSGLPGQVQHHVYHKLNYRLRFDTRNGINLTNPEHCKVTFSNPELCNEVIERREGEGIWDYYKMCKLTTKTDLKLVKIELEREYAKYSRD